MREGYELAELVGGWVDGSEREVRPEWDQLNVSTPPCSWTFDQRPEDELMEPDMLVYYRVRQRRRDGTALFVWGRLLNRAGAGRSG